MHIKHLNQQIHVSNQLNSPDVQKTQILCLMLVLRGLSNVESDGKLPEYKIKWYRSLSTRSSSQIQVYILT